MFPASTKILIVDDMQLTRDLVSRELKKLGFENLVDCADGVEALKQLYQAHEAQQPFGLIISDWNMPNMTGIEFLTRVRKEPFWANLPFILLTAESEKDRVMEAVIAGVSQYIVKPIAPDSIQAKMLATWKKHNPK